MCTYQLLTDDQLSTTQPQSCGALPPKSVSPTLRKRTIRFGDEDEDMSRPTKRRIIELTDVPPSSQMTVEERSARWMEKADHRATYNDVAEVVKSCQASGEESDFDQSFSSSCSNSQRSQDAYVNFAEALATVYNICYEDEESTASTATSSCSSSSDNEEEEKKLPLDQMIVFGASHTRSRGLESKIIPGLGGHRYKKRKEQIMGVLGVQRELLAMKTSEDDMAEGLGAVSGYLSKSSRRFARALGAVDGTMALLEYATTNSTSDEGSDEVTKESAHLAETQASCIGAFLSMQATESIVA